MGDIVVGRYGRDMLRVCNFVQYRFEDADLAVVALYCYPNAVGVDVTIPLAGENVWHVRVELTATNELHNYLY